MAFIGVVALFIVIATDGSWVSTSVLEEEAPPLPSRLSPRPDPAGPTPSP